MMRDPNAKTITNAALVDEMRASACDHECPCERCKAAFARAETYEETSAVDCHRCWDVKQGRISACPNHGPRSADDDQHCFTARGDHDCCLGQGECSCACTGCDAAHVRAMADDQFGGVEWADGVVRPVGKMPGRASSSASTVDTRAAVYWRERYEAALDELRRSRATGSAQTEACVSCKGEGFVDAEDHGYFTRCHVCDGVKRAEPSSCADGTDADEPSDRGFVCSHQAALDALHACSKGCGATYALSHDVAVHERRCPGAGFSCGSAPSKSVAREKP